MTTIVPSSRKVVHLLFLRQNVMATLDCQKTINVGQPKKGWAVKNQNIISVRGVSENYQWKWRHQRQRQGNNTTSFSVQPSNTGTHAWSAPARRLPGPNQPNTPHASVAPRLMRTAASKTFSPANLGTLEKNTSVHQQNQTHKQDTIVTYRNFPVHKIYHYNHDIY